MLQMASRLGRNGNLPALMPIDLLYEAQQQASLDAVEGVTTRRPQALRRIP
jgi:hypothetical protein